MEGTAEQAMQLNNFRGISQASKLTDYACSGYHYAAGAWHDPSANNGVPDIQALENKAYKKYQSNWRDETLISKPFLWYNNV